MSRASALPALASAAAAAGFGLFAPPAHAADVTRVALGSAIEALVAGPDGGAWVSVDGPGGDAIGRATPDGRFITAPVASARTDGFPFGGALGPDGRAWFKLGDRGFVRSDAAGTLTPVRLPDRGPMLGGILATGPDATLWSLTPDGSRVAHVTPAGTATATSTRAPRCGDTAFDESGSPSPVALERATDGAMWFADAGCSRLVRVATTGTTQVDLEPPAPRELAADASGGMWFGGEQPGHVDAAGGVRRFALKRLQGRDVAVAPDGSAWFATGTCTLARIGPGGEVTTVPAPIPARRIGFDPAGGTWLASSARLVHLSPGEAIGACDERPPAIRVNRGRRTVSLRALRRAGGVSFTAREPVAVFAADAYTDGSTEVRPVIVSQPGGGTGVVRVPAAQLKRFERALAAGKRPRLGLLLFASDLEGNSTVKQLGARVVR